MLFVFWHQALKGTQELFLRILKLDSIENFVVISDVHLRDPQDELTNLFIQSLLELKEVDAVFLLGDIFDFIAVSSSFFFDYWKNVFHVFQKLKSKEFRCIL
jgi:UDP-2,3-diacylglucosamine pyrophosphatase LpxH